MVKKLLIFALILNLPFSLFSQLELADGLFFETAEDFFQNHDNSSWSALKFIPIPDTTFNESFHFTAWWSDKKQKLKYSEKPFWGAVFDGDYYLNMTWAKKIQNNDHYLKFDIVGTYSLIVVPQEHPVIIDALDAGNSIFGIIGEAITESFKKKGITVWSSANEFKYVVIYVFKNEKSLFPPGRVLTVEAMMELCIENNIHLDKKTTEITVEDIASVFDGLNERSNFSVLKWNGN